MRLGPTNSPIRSKIKQSVYLFEIGVAAAGMRWGAGRSVRTIAQVPPLALSCDLHSLCELRRSYRVETGGSGIRDLIQSMAKTKCVWASQSPELCGTHGIACFHSELPRDFLVSFPALRSVFFKKSRLRHRTCFPGPSWGLVKIHPAFTD